LLSTATEALSATIFFTESGINATRASPGAFSRKTTMFIFSSN